MTSRLDDNKTTVARQDQSQPAAFEVYYSGLIEKGDVKYNKLSY